MNKLSKDTKIVIWGSGVIGHKVAQVLNMLSLKLVDVIDSDQNKVGQVFENKLCIKGLKDVGALDEQDTLFVLAFGRDKYVQCKKEVLEYIKYGRVISYQELMSEIAAEIYNTTSDQWNMDYLTIVRNWLKVLPEEIPWHFKDMERLQGKTRIPKEKIERLDKIKFKDDQVLIDMGCGGTLVYSPVINGVKLNYYPTDVLADAYDVGHKKYDFIPNTPIGFAMSELLTKWFPEYFADFIIYDNSLDHTLNPVRSIIESFRVLKKGGILSLKHHIVESMFGLADGLHMWDFFEDNRGDFIIARGGTENVVNISSLLKDSAEIQVWKEKIEGVDVIDICVNIIKHDDISNEIINLYDDNNFEGILIHELMRHIVLNAINAE